ncbi:MAG TPA: ornithine carbamoyltransferase [Mycobacteriales bacterium]|nr:ornithine carbamoyltransferase [Mycobacteriales bacterium]
MGTPRHFLVDDDLAPSELEQILDDASRRKINRYGTGSDRVLEGRAVALIFEKPSTRTRVSFEVGVSELGGHPVVIDASTTQLGRGETLEDTAMVLSRYCAAIVIRTFGQDRIERLSAASSVPVINALTDYAHPCQAVADLQTIRERRGSLSGLTLSYLGDGNNVAHSLLLAGAAAGMRVRVATPPGYEPLPQVVKRACGIATETGGAIVVTTDPMAAAKGADVLYTDVWASMGQEAESASRLSLFQGYQISDDVVAAARDDVVVLHCLPAHRGEEIAASVIDGPHSAVWDQAENRLHAQKALLAFLIERSG